jgi:hypothetical protein
MGRFSFGRLKTVFLLYVLPTMAIFTIITLALGLTMEDCVKTVVFTGIPLGLLIGSLATEEV